MPDSFLSALMNREQPEALSAVAAHMGPLANFDSPDMLEGLLPGGAAAGMAKKAGRRALRDGASRVPEWWADYAKKVDASGFWKKLPSYEELQRRLKAMPQQDSQKELAEETIEKVLKMLRGG